MDAALLVGPGCGWSGFIATSAAVGAPFTLASGGETLRRTSQGACVYAGSTIRQSALRRFLELREQRRQDARVLIVGPAERLHVLLLRHLLLLPIAVEHGALAGLLERV